jgi:hypothetical protein
MEWLEVDGRPVPPWGEPLSFQPMEWVEALSLHEPGNYKGYLTFHEHILVHPEGLFFFRYENSLDYKPITYKKVPICLKELMDSYSLDES